MSVRLGPRATRREEAEETEFRYLRTMAVITPMELDPHARKFKYINYNGRVLDPRAVHEERRLVSVWTEEEKELFLEKYLEYPKNFRRIASFFDNRSTNEVIAYYYQNKRELKLKRRVRQLAAKRKRRPTAPAPSDAAEREAWPETPVTPAPPAVSVTHATPRDEAVRTAAEAVAEAAATAAAAAAAEVAVSENGSGTVAVAAVRVAAVVAAAEAAGDNDDGMAVDPVAMTPEAVADAAPQTAADAAAAMAVDAEAAPAPSDGPAAVAKASDEAAATATVIGSVPAPVDAAVDP